VYNLVSPRDRVLPIFEVSAVGFNNEHTRALVYVGHICGGLCGRGTYHLMVKINGKWEPDNEFRRAPFCLWRRNRTEGIPAVPSRKTGAYFR